MLIFWGYIVELILAGAVYILLLWVVGGERLALFLSTTWAAWSALCGTVLAAAVAMFILIVQMLTSEFGGYLVSRSADIQFKQAFGFAIAYSFIGTIAFVFVGNVGWRPTTHIAGVFLLLTTINLYTMVTNTINLHRLYVLFEKENGKENVSG